MKLEILNGAIRFLTVDPHAVESDVPCSGCLAPCCRTNDRMVLLSASEAQRLPFELRNVELPDGQVVENVAHLPRHPKTGDCVFRSDNGMCSIYELRPLVCRSFDCRTDARMSQFVKERFGT